MKMWCSLNKNSANTWREYNRCGVAFPWPASLKYFWGKGSFSCFCLMADDGGKVRVKPVQIPRLRKITFRLQNLLHAKIKGLGVRSPPFVEKGLLFE